MKILIVLMLVSKFAISQSSMVLEDTSYVRFLYFLPQSDNLISLVRETWKDINHPIIHPGYMDTSYDEIIGAHFNIISTKSGELLKRISVPQKGCEIIAFNVSHDGSSFVILSQKEKHEAYFEFHGPFTLEVYLINEDRWAWKTEWYADDPPFDITYSNDNKQIIGITPHNTVVIDAMNGSLINKRSAISSINKSETRYLKHTLSKNGKYAALWWPRYLAWSLGDESGFWRLADLALYGIKWIFSLGDPPNYFYIWDVNGDSLYCKFRIPYKEGITGTPAFTDDEKQVTVGPFDGVNYIYSLQNRCLEREFNQYVYGNYNISIYCEGLNGAKIISPNNSYLVGTFPDSSGIFRQSSVLVFNYKDGYLKHQWPYLDIDMDVYYHYAITFSQDSKFCAIVTYSERKPIKNNPNVSIPIGNKIVLYDTDTWKEVWER